MICLFHILALLWSFFHSLLLWSAEQHPFTHALFLKAKCKSQEFIFFANKHFFPGIFITFRYNFFFFFLKTQIKSDYYETSQRTFAFIYRAVPMKFLQCYTFLHYFTEVKEKRGMRLITKSLAHDLIDQWVFSYLTMSQMIYICPQTPQTQI